MKKITILLFIISSSILYSQKLTIDETINYINEKTEGSSGKIEISDEGTLIFKKNKWINGELIKGAHTQEVYLNQIEVLKKPSTQYKSVRTILKCINNNYCVWNGGLSKDNIIEFSFGINENRRDKVFNAFKYLLALIKESNKFNLEDDDPFANENFNKTYTYITGIKSKEEIKLERDSGVFYIKVNIGGVNKNFVLDSGASEISISSNLERELIATGNLKKEDYLQPALYKIADGTIVTKRRVLIHKIKVGDFIINNVTASVGTSDVPLLLGKSFLDKFSKWSINNNKDILTLEN